MPRTTEKIFLILSDFITINLTFFFWIILRKELGFYIPGKLPLLSFLLFLVWAFCFMFFGLYRSWYARSRFDEFVVVLKTISIGVGLIFVATFDAQVDLESAPSFSRIIIIIRHDRPIFVNDEYSADFLFHQISCIVLSSICGL